MNNPVKRILAFFIFLVILFSLFACAGPDSAESSSVSSSDIISDTSSVISSDIEQKNLFSSDSYKKTGIENLYSIDIPLIKPDFYLICSSLKDNYCLVNSENTGDNYCCNIVLFNIENPEKQNSLEYEYFVKADLLDNGKIITVTDEIATLYTSELTVIDSFNIPESSIYLGADSERLYFSSDRLLTATDYSGSTVFSIEITPYLNIDSYVGTCGNRIYFYVMNEVYNPELVFIDKYGTAFTRIDDDYLRIIPTNGKLQYTFGSFLCTADLCAPEQLFIHDIDIANETLMNLGNSIVATAEAIESDSESNDSPSDYIYKLYSRYTGEILSSFSSADSHEDGFMCSIAFQPDDYILLSSTTSDNRLYIWDISGYASENTDNSNLFDISDKSTVISSILNELEEKYGFDMLTSDSEMNLFDFDYILGACHNESALLASLIELREVLKGYPKGFFQELVSEEKKGIRFFLCDSYTSTGYGIAAPAAAVNVTGDYLNITFNVYYFRDMKRHMAHELMHVMESRIDEYSEKNKINLFYYWMEILNSDKFPYNYGYLDENGNEFYDPTGTFDGETAPDRIWFIDSYSRSNYLEDRARIIENLFMQNEMMFNSSPHLMDKARFLVALIREVFPSIKNTSEPFTWEKITGIVELTEENFFKNLNELDRSIIFYGDEENQ